MRENGLLVSIITTCLNSAATIGATFESILNQTYKTIQYIIIDGGSEDGTLEIIAAYAPKFEDAGIAFEWVSETDSGIYDAMNKGIGRAKGALLGILNSDDRYEPEGISEMARAYRAQEHRAALYHGRMRKLGARGETLFIRGGPSEVSDAALFRQMPINHPSMFVSHEVYKRVGLFDTSYRLSADYDFVVRAYLSGVPFVSVDKVITTMSAEGASERFSNRRTRIAEDYRIRRRHFRNRGMAAAALFAYKMGKYYLTSLIRRLTR